MYEDGDDQGDKRLNLPTYVRLEKREREEQRCVCLCKRGEGKRKCIVLRPCLCFRVPSCSAVQRVVLYPAIAAPAAPAQDNGSISGQVQVACASSAGVAGDPIGPSTGMTVAGVASLPTEN